MPRPSRILHSRQAILERRRQVASFRVAGIRDQHAIAQQLKCSVGTINGDFKALDQQYTEFAARAIATEKGLDLERIETLIAALWRDAKAGKLNAIDRVIDLLTLRGRLLGLEAPRKAEISGADGGPIEIDARLTLSEHEVDDFVLAIIERAGARVDSLSQGQQPALAAPNGTTNGSVAH